MSDAAAAWLAVVAAGAAAAGLHLAGLWWTVRRLPRARHPIALTAASFLARTALVAVALLAVARGDPWRLLAAAAGFLVTRAVIIQLARAGAGRPARPAPTRSRP